MQKAKRARCFCWRERQKQKPPKGVTCAILAKSKICQKGKNGKLRLQWAR